MQAILICAHKINWKQSPAINACQQVSKGTRWELDQTLPKEHSVGICVDCMQRRVLDEENHQN